MTAMFFTRNWLSTTIEEFVAAVDTYIRCYNDARIKISLGFRSPVEHRRGLGSLINQSTFFAAPPVGQILVGVTTMGMNQTSLTCSAAASHIVVDITP